MLSKYACTHGQFRKRSGSRVIPLPSTACRQIPDPLANWQAPLPGRADLVAALAEPVPQLAPLPPELQALRDKVVSNPAPYLQQIDELLKDPSQRDCCFAQYAYELFRIGEEGAEELRKPSGAVPPVDPSASK